METFASISLPANREHKEQCMVTYYDEVRHLYFTKKNKIKKKLKILKKLCNNFIKTVLHRRNEKDLYACGNNAFAPRLFQLSVTQKKLKTDFLGPKNN